MGSARPGHLDALTGLRILAAGAVFLCHTPIPLFLPDFVRTFMMSGYTGVTVFFILSGFVLTWSYSRTILPLTGRGMWSFAVARFARIYPLYLVGLLIAVIPLISRGRGEPLMLLHATTLQVWSGDVSRALDYNGPAWSIGVEVFLYACFPLLILALVKIRDRPRALLAIALLAVAIAFALAWWFVATGRAALPTTDPESVHRWLYRTPITRLGDFVLGAAIALLVMLKPLGRNLAVPAQIVGLGSIVVLMSYGPLFATAWSWDAAYMIPAALLIWGLASAPHHGLSKFLATKPMVILGEASFAFYILHWPIVGFGGFITIEYDSWWSWALHATGAFVLMLAIAILAHYVIERPSQRWLRSRLSPRRMSPTEVLSQDVLLKHGTHGASLIRGDRVEQIDSRSADSSA